MILEEGTDEQMLECACWACTPRVGERWLWLTKDVGGGIVPMSYEVLDVIGPCLKLLNHGASVPGYWAVDMVVRMVASGSLKRTR